VPDHYPLLVFCHILIPGIGPIGLIRPIGRIRCVFRTFRWPGRSAGGAVRASVWPNLPRTGCHGARQGLLDMHAGRTISLGKFKAHARRKHGIKA
jgi:hypothetical protein